MGGGEGERGEGRSTLYIRSPRDGQDGLCHSPAGRDEGEEGVWLNSVIESSSSVSIFQGLPRLSLYSCAHLFPSLTTCVCVYSLLQPALSGVTVLSVNCMSVTTPQALYSRLATQLHVEAARGRVGRGKESTRDRLMTHVTSSKKLM